MKLSSQETAFLQNILQTCSICGIESIIIEDGLVRGASEAKTCAIISNYNVPQFSQKIGLSRLGSLKSRLDLFSSAATLSNVSIDAKETERGEISVLDISAPKSKVQFRCTSTSLIKAPKQINDELSCEVTINKNELKLVLDGSKVMTAKRVVLSLKSNKTVSFELLDSTNDKLTVELDAALEVIDPDFEPNVFYYPADVFAAIMKNSSEKTGASDSQPVIFAVGQAGTIKVQVNGHSVTMLPQVNEDGDE